MFSIRAKWADVARRCMYQTMSDHFIFSFEAFPIFPSWAARDGTVVWSTLRVYVGV